MKKFFFLMVGVLGALASCQKDNLSTGGNGQEVAITIAASLPSSMTKAITDKGGIDNVNWDEVSLRYTLEVYDGETLVPVQKDGATQRYQYKTVASGAKSVSFENIRLLSGKTYQFVVWADFVNKGDQSSLHYDISGGLKSITQLSSNLVGNDDSRDAYFATETIRVSAPVTQSVTLKRPFGKLRVITTDIKDIHVAIDNNTTTTVTYRTPVPTGFNAYNGTVSAQTAIPAAYTAKIEELTANTATLAFDYIFAEATTADVPVQKAIDFEIECLGAKYDFSSNSVKIERNKLTTVKGNLLTKGVTLDITIDDIFENEIVNEIVDIVPTVNAVQEKLNKAADEVGQSVTVKVSEPVSATHTITIPEAVRVENTPKIDLNFSAGITSGQTLTITEEKPTEPSTHYVGEVYITVPTSDAAHLVINMPSSTVYVNGVLQNLTATVSPNTLVIGKDAVVENLTIEKGNIEVFGSVSAITRSQSNPDEKTIVIVHNYAPFNASAPSNLGSGFEVVNMTGSIVNSSTGKLYSSIQLAIDEAAPNHIITVGTGSFKLSQSLVINKPITLRGAGAENSTIDGSDSSLELLNSGYSTNGAVVIASDNVTFDGFTVLGSSKTSWGVIVVGINNAGSLPAYFPSEGSSKVRIAKENYMQPTNVTIKNVTMSAGGAAVGHGFFVQAKEMETNPFTAFVENVTIKDINSANFCAAKMETGNIQLKNFAVENVKGGNGVINFSGTGRVEFNGLSVKGVNSGMTILNNNSWQQGWKPLTNGTYGWNWITVKSFNTNAQNYKMTTFGKYNAETGVVDGVANNNMGLSFSMELAVRNFMASKGVNAKWGEQLLHTDVAVITADVMDLSNQDITDMGADLYSGQPSNFAMALRNIKKIDLSGNSFAIVPAGAFCGPATHQVPMKDESSLHSLEEIVLPVSCNTIFHHGIHKLPSLKKVNLGNITCITDYGFACNAKFSMNILDLNPNIALGKKAFMLTPVYGNLDEYAKRTNIWFGVEWNSSVRINTTDNFSFEETNVTGTAASLQNSPWTYKAAFTNSCAISGDELVVPTTITEFGSHLFQKWLIKTATIPASVVNLGSNIFNQCANLETINLYYSVGCMGSNLLGGSTAKIKAINIQYVGQAPTDEVKKAFEKQIISETDYPSVENKINWIGVTK